MLTRQGETFESMTTLLIDHAPSLTHEAAMRQIATALDFIVFIDREEVTDRITGEPTEIRYVSEIIQVGHTTKDSPVPATAEVFGPLTDPEMRLLDPRGYPRGPLPLDENLWARRAGLDMAWLTDEHGAWDSEFPIRGFS